MPWQEPFNFRTQLNGAAATGSAWIEDHDGEPRVWWQIGDEANIAGAPPVLALR